MGRRSGQHGLVNLIRQRNKHKGVPRPDVQVVRVEQKRRITAGLLRGARGHLELNIFVGDVLLLEIHPAGMGVWSARVSTP